MAVPKKKTSKSRRDKRRSHLALDAVQFVVDKKTGEDVLPHRICGRDGTYKGFTVAKKDLLAEISA